MTTLFLGWWGVISLIVTPFFLLNNIFRYLMAWSLRPVPEDASIPQLTDADRDKIAPHIEAFLTRLDAENASFQEVAEEFAQRIGVTPGQIALAIREIVDQE